jgi:malate dehydrogenase (oxaloacetate-decarboxylating)(NADP+)
VSSEHREAYALELFQLRQGRGVTQAEADTLINDRNVFGSMMVRMGDADALVSVCNPTFPRHDPPGAADCSDTRRLTPCLRLLRHDHA